MKQLIPALFAVGAVMALIGAAVFITGWVYAPYIYTIGAGFVALAQVNTPLRAKSKTLRRLRIQQIFGALALILTELLCSPHVAMNGLPALLSQPYWSYTRHSVFRRKKKKNFPNRICFPIGKTELRSTRQQSAGCRIIILNE